MSGVTIFWVRGWRGNNMLRSHALGTGENQIELRFEQAAIAHDSQAEIDDDKPVYRPIQYLGNKLRSVSSITEIAGDLLGAKGRFLDLFTGTSVVAQSLANSGWKVTALDAQAYSYVMAHSLLGIGRKLNESVPTDVILNAASPDTLEPWFAHWETFAQMETAALGEGDYKRLGDLYRHLPLIWRGGEQNSQLNKTKLKIGEAAFYKVPLITILQSGTYFGIRQSLEIDLLRNKIETAYSSRTISTWQKNALLTGLMSAMSTAVHSAGKHFAQPLSAGRSENFKFLCQRMLQDRSVCIRSKFRNACEQISVTAHPRHDGHNALQTTAEDFIENSKSGFDVVYADPPYTAQQYSRFYHLLETIVNYEFPDLYHNGSVTTGLYPTNRFKSAFCSKRSAKKAFHRLVSGTKQLDAHLIVSYSKSSAKSTGNSRMISISDLLALCSQEFGDRNVECVPLSHKYRQFNSRGRANVDRDDPEVLIVCSAR